MKPNQINVVPIEPNHDKFKLGQGYASSEKGSDAIEKSSLQQFGDNPLPESGGEYSEADEIQPETDEDLEDIEGIDTQKKTTGKSKSKLKKYHH